MQTIGTVVQRLNGKVIMTYNQKKSGARMPLITSSPFSKPVRSMKVKTGMSGGKT